MFYVVCHGENHYAGGTGGGIRYLQEHPNIPMDFLYSGGMQLLRAVFTTNVCAHELCVSYHSGVVHKAVCRCICWSFCLLVYLSICRSVRLCMSVCLSVFASVMACRLFVCFAHGVTSPFC